VKAYGKNHGGSLFDELDANNSDGASQGKGVLSVSQALALAKGKLESIRITVEGEISEFNDKPGYKAAYFTLADKTGALPCQMWHNDYARSGMTLRRGMMVQVTGNFSLYPAKGRMNFVVRTVSVAGEGKLRMQVAQLAKKLSDEGLMNPDRKKPLPRFPWKVAVVTSPRGKAVHDVLRTLRRISPAVEVYVAGVPVEGANAPLAICNGLKVADDSDCDVILLVRGGGSYEDLMPFNDERVARQVAACRKPVVTGIGHEPDNTIADMVADVRRSTPTSAAEICVQEIGVLPERLAKYGEKMRRALLNTIRYDRGVVKSLSSRQLFTDPNYLLSSFATRVDIDSEKLSSAIPDQLDRSRRSLQDIELALRRTAPAITPKFRQQVESDEKALCQGLRSVISAGKMKVGTSETRMSSLGGHLLDRGKSKVAIAAAKLDGLSPLSVLGRGYSIAFDDGGHVISSVGNVEESSKLSVMLKDGNIKATVDSVEKKDPDGGKDDRASR
jgi:exodeoxyribonuclease VII large subunit